MKLQKIKYTDLNAKAQETYNFHKAACILADYGYNCIWLSNDWNGADFIAVHIDGISDIKVQLKGGPSFAKKYKDKNLNWITWSMRFFKKVLSVSHCHHFLTTSFLDQVSN